MMWCLTRSLLLPTSPPCSCIRGNGLIYFGGEIGWPKTCALIHWLSIGHTVNVSTTTDGLDQSLRKQLNQELVRRSHSSFCRFRIQYGILCRQLFVGRLRPISTRTNRSLRTDQPICCILGVHNIQLRSITTENKTKNGFVKSV